MAGTLNDVELMEVEIYNSLKALWQEKLSNKIYHFGIWNNQVEKLKSPDPDGMPLYNVRLPALYIEFVAPTEIITLGNGVQGYDPYFIKFHIVHQQVDAGDGTMDDNLDIFILKQDVYKVYQNYEPDGCKPLDRVSEEQDYDHNQVYHYMQTYQTNYADNMVERPVDGTLSDGNTELVTEVILVPNISVS